VLTVIESTDLLPVLAGLLDEEERGEFAAYIATTPRAGDLIRGSGGCRKVRWSRPGSGKSGGVRVIYVGAPGVGAVVLLTIYGKGARDTIPANVLRALARRWVMRTNEKALRARDAKRDIGANCPGHARCEGWQGQDYTVPAAALARREARMSQAKFADMLGVSARTLQQWEQGRRETDRRGAVLIEGRPSQSKAGAHRSPLGADRSRGAQRTAQDDAAQEAVAA